MSVPTEGRMPAPARCPCCAETIPTGTPILDLGPESPRGGRRYHAMGPCADAARMAARARAGSAEKPAEPEPEEHVSADEEADGRATMRMPAAPQAQAEDPEIQAAEAALALARERAEARRRAREAAEREAVFCAPLAGKPGEEEAAALADFLSTPYWPNASDVTARACLTLGLPLALVGEPGTGKTTAAMRLLGRLSGRMPVLVSCSDGATYRALVGGIAAKDGATYWQDGILSAAIRAGRPVVLDEVGAAAPTVLAAAHAYLAGQGLPILETGETLTDQVPVVLTSNLLGAEVGAGALHEAPLSAAFSDRCAVVRYRYDQADSESKLALFAACGLGKPGKVQGLGRATAPAPEALSSTVSAYAQACEAIRKARDSEGLSWAPGRRTLLLAARWLAHYGLSTTSQEHLARAAILDRYPPSEAEAVREALQRFVPRALGIEADEAKSEGGA